MEERPRRSRPKLIERLEERRETHRERSRLFRIGFGVVGALVLLGGLVMLVTPGPAFVLIPIGLAMLSLEFVWAERLLEKSLEQAQIAQEKAAQTTRTQRILAAIATVLGVAAFALAWLWWDIPIIP
ncbi:MAG TPA: PGPGW domain-containing protein, partial [Solirubrobacteraceae bacterium]|nr:PGPGW domain-containing protein [Solirubrobacteraceae bacterium]